MLGLRSRLIFQQSFIFWTVTLTSYDSAGFVVSSLFCLLYLKRTQYYSWKADKLSNQCADICVDI